MELKTPFDARQKQGDKIKGAFNWNDSFTIWLLLMLTVLAFALSQMNYYKIFPKERISPAMHTRAATNFKYEEWKKLPKTSSGKTDVVIAGSSLPMCGFYYADEEKDGQTFLKIKEKGLKLLQAYTAANYFEKKIEEKTKKNTKVFNASIAAAMISDMQLIVCKLMDSPPKKIILCVGMRDFADNINVSLGGTPVYQSLFDLSYAVSGDNLLFLWKNAKQSTIEDLLAFKLIPFYSIHSELKSWISEETEKFFQQKIKSKTKISNTQSTVNHSAQPPVQSQESAAESKESKPISLNILDYKQRYMPFNFKQMALERQCLERICLLCQKKNVELILVNMPVSRNHHYLSSKQMRQEYLNILNQVSTKHGIKYINFENSKLFDDQDFLDTVHLGPQGAVKFVDYLANESGVFAAQ